MSNQNPNSLKAMLWKGQIHATNKAGTGAVDVFKIILMQAGFVFDKDAHHGYADVSASELPDGNGYTAGGITLTGVDLITDDSEDRAELTWNNIQWNVSGGALTYSGAILYDDTTNATDHDYADAIVSYKDAGGSITANDGTPVIISSILEAIEDNS